MTKSKYEIGSQWKTRGGWKAVVVNEIKDMIDVCHHHNEHDIHNYNVIAAESSNGKSHYDKDHDLIEPWVEPRSGEAWFNVYYAEDGEFGLAYATKHEAIKAEYKKPLARIRAPWTEGQFDD